MVDNNQGFAAVVSAIERLRDTAYNNTGLRISVSRARLMEEKKQTDEIKKLAGANRKSAGGKGSQGDDLDGLQSINQALKQQTQQEKQANATLVKALNRWFSQKQEVTLSGGVRAILEKKAVARNIETGKYASTQGLNRSVLTTGSEKIFAGVLNDSKQINELKRQIKELRSKADQPSINSGVGKTFNLPSNDVNVDAKRFQYKLISNGQTGVSGSLRGIDKENWDAESAGVITVWKDPEDGKYYVINGHNRLAKVKEIGVESVNVLEIEAKSAKEARAKGALQNIREGQGSLLDAADFFRQSDIKDTKKLQQLGVPLSQKKAEMAIGIAGLPGDLYTKTLIGEIPQERAALIGGSDLDEQKQREIFALAEKQKLSNDKLKAVIDDLKAQNIQQQYISVGLFDDFINGILERAELITAIEKRLDSQLRLLRQVSDTKKSKFVKVEGIGSLDAKKAKKLTEDVESTNYVFGKLKNQDPFISGMISKGGQMIASGRDKDDIEENSTRIVRSVSPKVSLGQNLSEYKPEELTETIKSLVNEKGKIDPVVFELTSSFPDNFQDQLFEINRQIEAGLDINSGEQAGASFGQSFLDGLQSSLEINSPSRKAQELAEYFVQGWVIGLQSLGISTDESLKDQGKKFRKQLRQAIIESRGQKRNSKGRYTEGNPEQLRDKQGRYIAESVQEQIAEIALEIKNLAIRGENVTLIANKVNLTSGENAKSTELRLAKAIAAEIRSKPLQVKTSLMGQLSAGFAFAFTQQLSKGFGRGTKKNTGINTEDIGYGVGNFITNPKGATAEGIGFRRRSRVQNSADLAREMAAKEKVDIDNNRENIFTVGGMGAKGKGGVYVAKEVESAFGKQKVKAIPFKTKNTDPLSDALKDPIEFAVDMYWNYINNLFLQGANPDAIKLAAKVIAAKKKNKNAKIQLVGHSQGGLVVEEAIAILAEAGISDVQGTGLGTPDAGIGYETKGQYRSVFGRTDEIATGGMAQVLPRQGKSQDIDNIPGVADLTGHKIGDYLNHPESLDRIAPDQKWAVIEKALDSQIEGIIREAKVSAKLGKSGAMSPQSLQKIGDRLIGEIRAGKQLIEESGQKSLAPFLDEYRQLSEQLGAVFPGLKADFEKLLQTFQTPSNSPRNVEAESSPEFDISPLQTAIADLRMEFDGLAAAIAGIRVLIEGTTEQATEPTPATEETPPDAPQTTAGKYGNYLQGIIAEARQTAEESIRALIPNFKSLGIQQKRDAAAGYNKGLQAQVKEYRKAVKAGDLALASELGEKLLADAQTVGKVYDDILAAVPDDYVGTKSLQTQRGQVTRIQNEVLAGDKGSGRSPVGLPDLVSNVEEMAGAGDNAAQGYLDGLLARIGDANQGGAAIGDATLEGLDQALDMHSPSEEMRKRGEMTGAGFEIGLVKSLKDAGQAAKAEINKLKATIAKDLEYFRAVATGDTAKAQAMVGDAAKGSGYNVGPVYHGTGADFNEFDPEKIDFTLRGKGFDFTSDIERAKRFAYGENPKTIASYLKIKSPLDISEDPQGFNKKIEQKYGKYGGDQMRSDFRASNNDGILWSNSHYTVFNPNQIKSADPVTKTDRGVPVPLSARFDDSVSDIRGNVTDVLAGLKSQAGEALQPFVAELETAFTSAGENSLDGLIGALEGALGQLRSLGGDIGETLSKGTEDALDIDSPSKVYKAIGKNIIAGLMQGMDGFEGTLEEKEKILETYVKSVIELIYSFKKVTGKPMGEAEAVRKLFQEIGQEGTATPAQLAKAQKYFPQVERLPDASPGVALYNPKQNKIKIKQGRDLDKLSADLMHEYTHAIQARFGVGMRFATTPADFFPKTAMSPKGEKHLEDPRVDKASDASANYLMGAFEITREQGRRYETQFHHVKRRESEAYANELGVGTEQQRRGFFKADADEIAAQIKAAREETKKAAAELKQAAEQQAKTVKEAGAKVGKAFADGVEEGKQTIGDRLNGFLDWLESIPVVGQLVKWGRQLAGVIAGLFGKKEQPKPQAQKPKPVQPKPVPVAVATPEVVTTQPAKPAEVQISPVEVAEQIEEIIEPVTQIEVQPETAPEPTVIEVAPIEVAQEIEETIGNAIDPQRQADRWLAYISQWAKNLGKTFDDSIGAEITELKASGKNIAQELRVKIDKVGNGLEQRQKQFRQAIADGNAQVAKAVGTELVEQSEQLRVLYKRMAENVKFAEGRGTWRDQAAEMTKVQKEAIKGYPNLKGRAKTGAWQAIAANTADGFTQGMEKELSDAEQSGYDLGEAAITGAKKALGIKSPSKEFLDIAKNVVEGWNNGLDALGDDAANNVRRFMRSISDGTDQAIQDIDQGIGQIFTTIGNAFPILKTFKGVILAIGAGFLIDAALGAIVDNFTRFAVGAFDSVVAAESLTRSFLSLTGSSAKARQSMAYAAQTAQELGIDLKTAEDAYKGMIATTRGSALEGLQTDQIFKSFSATAAARGLNAEEQGRMFAAIQQMLSKNKLSAEEVRGQLGEISALDFQGTLARSMGVSVAQLDEAMSSGSLMAADVLPKVAAQYAAENAIVSNSSDTTAQAMTRYSNALELLRRSMGEWFAEAKFLFNAAASGIELITKIMPALIQWVSALGLVLAWNSVSLFAALVKIPIVSKIVAIALRELGKAIGFILSGPGLKMLATYAAQIILIQFAFDAVSAAVNTTQNRFTEYANAIEKTRKAVEAMEAAQAKLNKTQSQAGKNLPTKPGDVVTDQTWKPFGIDTGINLEPVRQTLGLTTLGEKQMNDFKIMASENSQQVNNVLSEGYQVTGEVEKITEIDRQLAIVRSRRFENIRGDKQAYEESVKAEKELLAKREEVLAYTSTYQASLDSAITSVEQRLADIEAMKTRGGITQDEANYQTTMAEAELADLKKARTEFEKLTNALTQSVNGLEREMRNLNEQTTAFNESLDRTATNNRVAFLRQASASGTGSTIRDMGLSALASNDSQARVGFLRDRLSTQELLLSDPEFAAIAEELRQQAAALGTDLENTATLDRIIAENRDGTTNQVAQLIKEILDTKTQLGQAEEQIAQSLIDQRGALTDLNRTIADFFQQLTQQFEEARIELDRVKNQLRYGGLKQKLQKALVPGSNSFINGVIGSIQGIFDQASSVMEAVLGQRSARLSFAGEKYSLDNQMTDFARSVNGATQAVEAFRASLAGGQATLNGAGQSGAVATSRGGGMSKGMVFPVRNGNIGTSAGQLYGANRDGGARKHKGIDLNASAGEPVYAVMGGTIKEVKLWDKNVNSHKVVIMGADGNVYTYGHVVPNQDIKQGQTVSTGQQIAKISQKDRLSSGPHLHFEAQKNGQHFNPTSLISGLPRPGTPQAIAAAQPIQTAIAGNANTGGDRQAINALLKRFNSKMTADDFYSVSQATGVQVDALVTQAMIESGFGTTGRGRQFNNPLNWGNDDAGNNKAFPTLRDGLMAGAQGLKDKFNFTSPEQFIANQFRGKYGVYATDPQYKQKYQSALNQVRSAGVGGNVATNVSYAQPQQQAIVATTPDPAIARGQKLIQGITGVKSAIVDGNGQLAQQQINGFLLEVNQQKQALDRQLDDATRMANNTIAESRNAFADLMQQYSPQTLDSQSAAEVRQANNTLRQQFNELFERRREQEDGIQGAKTAIAEMQGIITILENRKNDVAPEQAVIDRAQIDLLKSAIPTLENEVIPAYEKALAVTKEQETQLNTLKTTMESWLQTQAKQRQLDQDGEMIALRASVAQASFNEQLKLKADLETVDNEYEKRKLQEQQRLIDQPELLKDVLAQLEKERDAKKKNLQYDFDALIRGRELEAVSRELGLAQSEFNSEKILSLEIAQAELEAEDKRLKILREITDEEEQRRQLELTDAEELQKIRRSELDNINRILDRKQGDRDLDSRQAENAANLSRNPFAATQLRENNAVANRQLEFERRAEEIRQTQPADRAAAMIAQESEILAQDLELIDREFRDLSETIGDNIGNAFNDFSNALINGDNALQAFTNSLLKAVSDIGSQLMQQGMNGLMQNIFGKSGAIGGLFGGGASSAGYSIADAIIPAFSGGASAIAGGFTGATAMLPGFAVGGYTGDGGKHEPKGIVHGGEFVINKEATRKIGLPALMSANSLGMLPGFATGGYVGSIESRLLSGLNSTRMPALSLPTQKNPATAIAGPVSNTVNVNINDRESRFYKQAPTIAREMANKLRG